MSLPVHYDFTMQRGAGDSKTFRKTLQTTGAPVDLTGLKARVQFRSLAGETGTSTSATLLLALANNAGVAVSDPTDGKVTLSWTVANTLTLCPDNIETEVAWGLELYNDAVSPELVYPFAQGRVTIRTEVVR